MADNNTERCCCLPRCHINNGKCNKMHKCVQCHRHLHAICGVPYYDEGGNEIEDIVYSRCCFDCEPIRRRIEGRTQPKTTATATTTDTTNILERTTEEDDEEGAEKERGKEEEKESRHSTAALEATPPCTWSLRPKGKKMTDKVDTTDTVAIMDDGERSDGSEAPSAHVVDDANANDDDEDTTSIDSAVLDDYVFTDEELKAFPCGWYVPDDLKEGEKVMDRFLGKNKKKEGRM